MKTTAHRSLFIAGAFAATLAIAAPLVAGGFAVPKGCTPFLTVQNKGCASSLLWRCDGDRDGDFTAASFGPDGLESVMRYSDSYQWLDSVYTWDKSREVFVPPATDPIDRFALLDTGIDTYDFIMRRSEPGRQYDIHITGADVLQGATTVIDGYTVEILDTRLEIVAEDGTTEYKSQGTQYYSRELGQFFLGHDTVFDENGKPQEYDNTPVNIIMPGEPGFAETTPLYECNLQDAAFTLAAPVLPAPARLSE